MGAVLEVRNLTKSFGNLRAVDDVSFGVEEKSITILIGPNGSGKTTLINVISGRYEPDSGEVLYERKEITGLPPHKVYRLGLARTFQIPALFLRLSVLENVMVAKKDNPGEGFARSVVKTSWMRAEEETAVQAFSILKAVGLLQMWEVPASNLSGGQMKLLEMARALMSGAKVLLLDEPISGVNPTLAHEIFRTMLSLRSELGVTFFVIEHRLDIALGYVDQVVAMALGKIIASGAPEKVVNDPEVIEAYLGA
jgi:branched-chain amino acid transport system ATP-binding protein